LFYFFAFGIGLLKAFLHLVFHHGGILISCLLPCPLFSPWGLGLFIHVPHFRLCQALNGSCLGFFGLVPGVNFYEFKGKDLLYERTYERGVEDFTYACGTGTGSLVTVLTLKGLVSGNNVHVQMQGGELIIDAEQENGQIKNLYLTGPTNMVLKGTLTDDALQL
ncbi:MAG: hypothetical protein IIX07_01115, partial [Lachnospiraceae bacterium]|nr:hypothetical protein [Lachnospiraceae bacterium]